MSLSCIQFSTRMHNIRTLSLCIVIYLFTVLIKSDVVESSSAKSGNEESDNSVNAIDLFFEDPHILVKIDIPNEISSSYSDLNSIKLDEIFIQPLQPDAILTDQILEPISQAIQDNEVPLSPVQEQPSQVDEMDVQPTQLKPTLLAQTSEELFDKISQSDIQPQPSQINSHEEVQVLPELSEDYPSLTNEVASVPTQVFPPPINELQQQPSIPNIAHTEVENQENIPTVSEHEDL